MNKIFVSFRVGGVTIGYVCAGSRWQNEIREVVHVSQTNRIELLKFIERCDNNIKKINDEIARNNNEKSELQF